MNLNRMQRLLPAASLVSALLGVPAMAQAPAPELALAFSSYHLRPATGVDQRLNGFTLGGRYGLGPAWSLEAALSRQTATEAGSVDLTQVGLVAGPRYSRVWTDRWQGFAHFQAGFQRLSASDGPDSDHSTTLVLRPGVGADWALNRRVSFRAQEDCVWTRYAGLDQHSTCFSLGVVVRK
jgi:Outer membrane protein beta-barrel domain